MTWTTPRTGWLPGDVLTAAEMEALSEDVAYLQGNARVIQMVANSYGTQYSTSSGAAAFFLSTGMTLQEASSKVLVMALFGSVASVPGYGVNLYVQRQLNGGGWANVIVDLQDSYSMEAAGGGPAPQSNSGSHSLIWLDSPALAAGSRYDAQMGLASLNGDTGYVNYGNSSSIIILAEVA